MVPTRPAMPQPSRPPAKRNRWSFPTTLPTSKTYQATSGSVKVFPPRSSQCLGLITPNWQKAFSFVRRRARPRCLHLKTLQNQMTMVQPKAQRTAAAAMPPHPSWLRIASSASVLATRNPISGLRSVKRICPEPQTTKVVGAMLPTTISMAPRQPHQIPASMPIAPLLSKPKSRSNSKLSSKISRCPNHSYQSRTKTPCCQERPHRLTAKPSRKDPVRHA